MNKRVNKKGQFFLIAAIVIIIVTTTLISVSNKVIEKKDLTKIEDLSKELYIESGYLIKEGEYDSLTDEQMRNLSRDFAKKYVDYIQEKNNYYFIFGRKNGESANLSFLYYKEITQEEICLNLTGNCEDSTNWLDGKMETFYLSTFTNPIKLKLGDSYTKEFTINEGDNFYYLIWRYDNDGGKVYIP
jgi:hypothetical protein